MSWLVSIKNNGRIYEATTFQVLMEVTVVRMFCLVAFLKSIVFTVWSGLNFLSKTLRHFKIY